ncbi:MAG: DUF4388 domain-containing protein, partial [Myxococcota bacterium]
MGDLPESGRLEERPLPRLLLDLQGGHFTGSLRLSRHRVEKEFLFHEGLPVLVESNRESERLGGQLVESEKISRDDHAKLKSYVEKEQCGEGKALLALGLMEPKDLFLAIKEQLRAGLVDCFGWTGGEFVLNAERKPPEDAQAFRTDLNQILQEGIETHWDTERIMTALGNRMSLFPVRGDRFLRIAPRLRSDDAVQALLERIDGSHTLWRCLQV